LPARSERRSLSLSARCGQKEVAMSVPEPVDAESARRRRLPMGVVVAGALLVVPLVALAIVPVYARSTPRLWGFPFFYWYQFLWVFLTAGCTYLAYLMLQHARRRGGAR
jgi:hypothetical protein